MPVRRFRDFEDARRALWTDSDDPNLGRRIRNLWARSARLAPPMIPRGLRKFRDMAEADRERREWTRRRIEVLRSRRMPGAD